MSENNLPNINGEENTAPIEENTSAVENAAVEEAASEQAAYTSDTDEFAAVEDEIFRPAEETEEEPEETAAETEYSIPNTDPVKKTGGIGRAVALVIIVIAVLAVIVVGVYKYMTRNPYNQLGYINVSGRTISDVAEQAGYDSVEEFLAEYSLPADMPADTEESAAYYSIPVKKIAEMYGMEVADLKELLGLGDDVTEETPWGEAEGKATLAKYIGEENLDAFKEEYGLGDDITGETLWGEIRNIVDQKSLEQQKAAEAAASQASDNAAVGDEDTTADEGVEAGDAAAESEPAAE